MDLIYDWLHVVYRDGALADILMDTAVGTCDFLGWACVVTGVLAAAYFYLIRNAASENKTGFWLLWLVVVSAINAVIGIVVVMKFDVFQMINEPIGVISAVMFGVANALFAGAAYIVASAFAKEFSSNLCHTPFPKIFNGF